MKFGQKTDRGWKFNDTYNFQITSHSNADLVKIKDDYMGAFKPTTGEPHLTGIGSNVNPQQQPSVAAPTGKGIVITLAATHSGLITRNNTLYLPDKMRAGVPTWTDHYAKPIQLHHDDHSDPVGRVMSARYVDTSQAIVDRFKDSVLKDSFNNTVGNADQKFWDAFNSDKVSFFKKLDMIKMMDSVLLDPHYQGVGYIELTANIIDPDAIAKVLDGRYLTGSVGAVSDKAVCSICGTDWVEDDYCAHHPGQIYDGKKCVLVAGNLSYDEYSFVNKPANRHSRVMSVANKDSIKDSAIKFFPVFDSLQEENEMTISDTSVSNDTSTETPILDSTVTGDKLSILVDKVISNTELSDEESEELYALQAAELDPEVVQDAKLTSEARKKLPLSAFCGPNRTFVANDCAHVIAARKLLSDYKGESSKDAIAAAVEKKAKALGCAKDSTATETIADSVSTVEVKVEDLAADGLALLFNASIPKDKLNDESKAKTSKDLIDYAISRLGQEIVDATIAELGFSKKSPEVSALLDEVSKQEDTIISLRDKVEVLERELKASAEDLTTVEDQLVKSKENLRSVKTSQVESLYTLDGSLTDEVKTSLTNLTDEVLDSTIKSLSAKVDIVKIADKINDGLSRIPTDKVDIPTGMTDSTRDTKPINTPTYASQKMVDEIYRKLLLKQGYDTAQEYYRDAVTRGFAMPKTTSKVTSL